MFSDQLRLKCWSASELQASASQPDYLASMTMNKICKLAKLTQLPHLWHETLEVGIPQSAVSSNSETLKEQSKVHRFTNTMQQGLWIYDFYLVWSQTAHSKVWGQLQLA